MRRAAAAEKASQAADALTDWLAQSGRLFARPEADDAPAARAAVPLGGVPESLSVLVPPPDGGARTRPTAAASVLRLADTDWLHHRLTVTGPGDALAGFREAAAGAGIIPWNLDLDRLQEDLFHLLVSPPPPRRRTLSVAGARMLAQQLRDAVARRHELGKSRVGRSRACPFDLHALVPVPPDMLVHEPDDPRALAWMWERWGTTAALRHVAAASTDASAGRSGGQETVVITFWSADWTPWRAIAAVRARWRSLQFDVRPSYQL